MNNKRNNSSGCFWIFMILLVLGGPRLIGYMFFYGVFFIFILLTLFFFGAFILFRNIGLKDYLKKQTDAHNLFVKYSVKIMLKIAEVDGTIQQEEIATIKLFFKKYMNYSSTQMFWVDGLISESIKTYEPLETLTDSFNKNFSIPEKRILIQMLYQIALADGIIKENERVLIDKIVFLLNFPQYEHDIIKNMFFSNNIENPFSVLNISENSTPEVIKKAYRNLCKENHPDKVTHLGEEFKKVAEEKMSRINQAYTKLQKMGKV